MSRCDCMLMMTANSAEGARAPADGTSLFAEYAQMLITVHAVFCGIMRLTAIASHPPAIAGIAASVWIVLRMVPAVRLRWFFPVVTLCIAAIVLQWDALLVQAVPAATAGPLFSGGAFSPFVLLAMLSVVMLSDVANLARHTAQNSRLRSQCSAFLLQYGLRFLICGIGGVIAAYTFVVPLVQEWIFQLQPAAANPKFAVDRLTLSQNMLFKFSESISGMWFFIVGTCVGSFLNVVIYRVPAGLSVVAKASHCPGCQQAISGRDNLPLFGWLKLKGRCRNCQIAISSRYPAVELTIGLMFLLLYVVELISGGTNLPGRAPNLYAGVLWILFYTKWDLVGLYVFHCFMLCALFSWSMIRRDGHQVPLKSVVITLTIVIAAGLLQPHLLPWTYNAAPTSTGVYSSWNAATSMLVGGLAAVILQVASMLMRRFWQRSHRIPFASWLLVGVTLGWQAIVGVLLTLAACALLQMVSRINSTHDDKWAKNHAIIVQPSWLLLPIAVLVHHCVWRQLAFCIDGWGTPWD